MPASAVRLATLVSSHDYDAKEVADLVAFDPALTLKVMRVANSAVLGGSSPVTTARDAVVRLGSVQILSIAVSSHARSLMQGAMPQYRLEEGGLWRHSVIAAVASEQLPSIATVEIPPESFTAALLHDIGKIVMIRFLDPPILEALHQAQTQDGLDLLQAEREILEVHHGEIGGLVAQSWKMPESIVKGIIYHHTPEEADDVLCDTVCLADIVAKAVESANPTPTIRPAIRERIPEVLGIALDRIEPFCKFVTARFAELSARYGAR